MSGKRLGIRSAGFALVASLGILGNTSATIYAQSPGTTGRTALVQAAGSSEASASDPTPTGPARLLAPTSSQAPEPLRVEQPPIISSSDVKPALAVDVKGVPARQASSARGVPEESSAPPAQPAEAGTPSGNVQFQVIPSPVEQPRPVERSRAWSRADEAPMPEYEPAPPATGWQQNRVAKAEPAYQLQPPRQYYGPQRMPSDGAPHAVPGPLGPYPAGPLSTWGLLPFPHPEFTPIELQKMSPLAYIVEPPDILTIESRPGTLLPNRPPITGERLVRPDGTVFLGEYGKVYVSGLTLEGVKLAIEEHLRRNFDLVKASVTVDVYAYNSKVYYVVFDGAGYGEQVFRLAYTGNETVLDGIGQVGGLPAVAAKGKVWVARPTVADQQSPMVLPVDWNGIVREGLTATNYHIQPLDRIYVGSDKLLIIDTFVAKLVSPVQRLFGVTLLGAATIKQLQNMGRSSGGAGAGLVLPIQ